MDANTIRLAEAMILVKGDAGAVGARASANHQGGYS